MKTRTKVILLILILPAMWLVSILHNNILTAVWGNEFADPASVGIKYMQNEEPSLRVMSYWFNKAEVYYFTPTGGEKVLFIKENGKWTYKETLANWSGVGGSADDYFIWPYFKNWVI